MTIEKMAERNDMTQANIRFCETQVLCSPARAYNGYRGYSEPNIKEVSHMTIKEMETLAGMTRANIRFYETEGLLSPTRASNGYREYSETDLEILKRIKLLRTLKLSLEEIKAIQTDQQELLLMLDAHLAKLSLDKTMIAHSQEICQTMCHDGVQYQTLDAQHYLDEMEHKMQKPVPELTTDATKKVQAPWRRFFARGMDFSIYQILFSLCLSFAPNILWNFGLLALVLPYILTLLLMMYIEPALLSRFGTTIGKGILGLSVTDTDGQRLTYSTALARTRDVLYRGEGFYIPIYRFVRNLRSYDACKRNETLQWEHDSILVLKDEKKWRTALYIVADVIMIILCEALLS